MINNVGTYTKITRQLGQTAPEMPHLPPNAFPRDIRGAGAPLILSKVDRFAPTKTACCLENSLPVKFAEASK